MASQRKSSGLQILISHGASPGDRDLPCAMAADNAEIGACRHFLDHGNPDPKRDKIQSENSECIAEFARNPDRQSLRPLEPNKRARF
jgi:hypothetical protein